MEKCNKCTNKVDLQKEEWKQGLRGWSFEGKMKREEIEYNTEND